MTFSPAYRCAPANERSFLPERGRTLARPIQIRTGHFLFGEPSQQFHADLTNTDEVARLPRVASAGAAMNRPSGAESRPSLFFKINHVSQVVLSVADTAEDSEG